MATPKTTRSKLTELLGVARKEEINAMYRLRETLEGPHGDAILKAYENAMKHSIPHGQFEQNLAYVPETITQMIRYINAVLQDRPEEPVANG